MKEDTESDPESLDLPLLQDPQTQCENNLSSYSIVFEQMRDLVIIQDGTIGNLAKANVETLSASKDIFDAALKEREKKIEMLEKSICTDYVPKVHFESLVGEMKDEQENHTDTQARLQHVEVQLDQALKRIKDLETEREMNIESFSITLKNLQKELAEANAKNNFLQSKLNETQLLYEQQREEILSQNQQINELEANKEMQTRKYRHRLHESEVEKQQEAYLQRMMADTQRKHKKPSKFH